MVGAFVAVFVLTNPYAAFDRSKFINLFTWQLKYSSTGYGVVGQANPRLWLEPLTEQFGAGGVLYLFGGFLIACGFLLWNIERAGGGLP